MKYKKRASLLLIGLVFLSVLLSISFVLGQTGASKPKKTYYFDGNFDFTEKDPILFNNVNQRYNYTQFYNATYSFEGEVGETGTDISFVDGTAHSSSTFESSVVSEYANHNNVLELSGDESGYFYVYNEFATGKTTGTIEFFFGSSEGEGGSTYFTNEETETMFNMYCSNTTIYIVHGDGAGGVTQVSENYTDIAHVKVEFNCSSDTFSCWVDGTEKITDENFRNDRVADTMNRLRLQLDTPDVLCYWDAVSYSWDDNYDIGDNVFPTTSEIGFNNTYEATYQDFTFDGGYDDAYTTTHADIPFYDEEEPGDNEISLYSSCESVGVCVPLIEGKDIDVTENYPKFNRTYSVGGEILDLAFDLGIGILGNGSGGGVPAFTGFTIFNQSKTEGSKYLRFSFRSGGVDQNDIRAELVSKSGDSFSKDIGNVARINQDAGTSEAFPEYFRVNLRFHNDTGMIRFEVNGTAYYLNSSLRITDKFMIRFECYNALAFSHVSGEGGLYNQIYFDRIEVRVDGKSLTNYYPSQLDAIPILAYNGTSNMRGYYIEGNASIGVFNATAGGYFNVEVGEYETKIREYFSDFYFRQPEVKNLFSDYLHYRFNSSSLKLKLTPILNNIVMKEGANEYPLIWSYDNIDPFCSYFYTNGTSLFAKFVQNDTTSNSYMEAMFDVNPLSSTNYTLSTFMEKSNWKFLTNFSSHFSDLSTYGFELQIDDDPIYLSSVFSRDLAPYKDLDYFKYRIGDGNEFSDGFVIGRLDPIIIKWVLDYPFSPDDLHNSGILAMLVPIAIIFVPSLAVSGYIREAGDKEMGKMSFLPLCCLFAFLFGLSGLVPLWVIFTLILVTLSYFFIKSRREA